jgi:hypothetical protein
VSIVVCRVVFGTALNFSSLFPCGLSNVLGWFVFS